MTVVAKRFPLLREAWDRLRWTHVLGQIALAAVVFGLVSIWLNMPESSVLTIACTVLMAIAIPLLAGGGEAYLLLSMAGEPRTWKKLLRGAGVVFLVLVLWGCLTWLLAHHGDDSLRASYIDSKLPRGLRNGFTYEHLLLLQLWFWDVLAWIATGLLAAILLPWILVNRPWPTASIACGQRRSGCCSC